jgi:hypothetical protein
LAEKATTIANRDEASKRLHFGRRQKETAASDPMLGSEPQNFDGFVVTVDMTDAGWLIRCRLEQWDFQVLEIRDMQGIEGTGCEMDQVVAPDVRSDELDRPIERGEFVGAVVSTDEHASGLVFDNRRRQCVVYDQDRPVQSRHPSPEDPVELLLRVGILLGSKAGENG